MNRSMKLSKQQAWVLGKLKKRHLLGYVYPNIIGRRGESISMWPNSRPIVDNCRIRVATFNALVNQEWIKVKFVGPFGVYYHDITLAGITALKEWRKK